VGKHDAKIMSTCPSFCERHIQVARHHVLLVKQYFDPWKFEKLADFQTINSKENKRGMA